MRARLTVAAVFVLLPAAFGMTPLPAAAAGNIQLMSSSQWGPDSIGSIHIVGEVKNMTGQYSEFNQVNFNFYDAAGNLQKTDFTFTTVDKLAPGELSPFHEIFTPPAGYNHYTIPSIDFQTTSAPPNHNFATQITNQFVDAIGAQHVVGTVTNNNSTADTYVEVVFTFYDCAGGTVDSDFTFINGSPPTLQPGANDSFELIRPSNAPAAKSVAAMTESSDPPSPYVLPARTVVGSAPDPPSSVTASAGDSSATVRWTPPTCSGGTGITGYTVTSSPGGLTATASGSSTQVGIAGLTNGTAYTFTVTATNASQTSQPSSPSNQVTPAVPSGTSFYFAEGFTGQGFQEGLSLFMPNQSGTAEIDYYTQSGHLPSVLVNLTAGQVKVENVNNDVGGLQQVSARVTLPGPGVVERTLQFRFNAWYGSTDKVGVTQASSEWDFAEGSTLPFFSEYLTLQNPNPGQVTATLNYFTDTGLHPTKTLALAANSRVTVEVFNGDVFNNVTNCSPNGVGANCGVGGRIGGVSLQVLSSGGPIIAERPFYVNGFSFGSGPVRDGHDAFGAVAPAKQWNFAEGTTLPGFNEYLTLQNPGTLSANVTLTYIDTSGNVSTRNLVIGRQARFTVEVFQPTYGVGPGVPGVSVQVTADQPIVAERPMYIYRDFGTGIVAGAHVVVGSTGLGTLFGFAAASTLRGDNDYLTVQNPGNTPASVTVSYYASSGKTVRTLSVAANTRLTIQVFLNDGQGLGPGAAPLGIVVQSSQPILVEKPTYSSSAPTYGATDTLGYSPASF